VKIILGISAYYHDSAAALVSDGKITAAAQEERFTRKKHDAAFPGNAIAYCLAEAGVTLRDVSQVVYYEKPFIKFERLLETYLSYAPGGLTSFVTAMPVWIKEKLFLKSVLRKELASLANCRTSELPQLLFTEHHLAHAASAFYPGPFVKAGVLCMDGVGEWATTSVWMGEGNTLSPRWQIDFPHSLGLLYSACTYFTGFKVNSGEYKLMGLAPYGQPKYFDLMMDKLIDVKDDGTFRMNMKYFNYATGLTMTSRAFEDLFDGPPRRPEQKLTQRDMDIACSVQRVTEEIIMRLARTVRKELDVNNLCLAGGVALNCVANGRLLREKVIDDIWVQPASGDAGGALGAALAVWHQYHNAPRSVDGNDSMRGTYLGPSFSDREIEACLDKFSATYQRYDDEALLLRKTAEIVAEGNVVGWFQGRMEFGPRALGNRSILGDPRNPQMQSRMNLKIKFRESFRPFAPSVLRERLSDYFDTDHESPYMLLTAPVKDSLRTPLKEDQATLVGLDRIRAPRSVIPAVTHVDFSARIQTVTKEKNPLYYDLIRQFEARTGCPVLVNTSFNVRGEPIVRSPEDAYRCFMRTEMDYLVMGNYLLAKAGQPEWTKDDSWKNEFEPD